MMICADFRTKLYKPSNLIEIDLEIVWFLKNSGFCDQFKDLKDLDEINGREYQWRFDSKIDLSVCQITLRFRCCD